MESLFPKNNLEGCVLPQVDSTNFTETNFKAKPGFFQIMPFNRLCMHALVIAKKLKDLLDKMPKSLESRVKHDCFLSTFATSQCRMIKRKLDVYYRLILRVSVLEPRVLQKIDYYHE